MARKIKEKTDYGSMEKDEAITTAFSKLEKQFGRGCIQFFGDGILDKDIEIISTGSIGLDSALGIGGVPRGRIIEVVGPESSGKTSACLQILANAQKQGLIGAFVDTEHALDIQYAARLGCDVKNIILSQPTTAEEALSVVLTLAETSKVGVIILDSVAALVPQAELDGDIGDSHMGVHARLMGQTLRKLVGIAAKTNTTVMFTNQIRQKIGVMFGSNETTPGGNALKFFASVRIDFRKKETLKEGDRIIGVNTKAKVIKNKCAPPFGECTFDVIFNEGISREREIINIGLDLGIIEKTGAWYSYDGERIGQGLANTQLFFKEHMEIREKVAEEINKSLKV